MSTTLATVDKILKDVYLEPIRDQLTDGNVLWQQFQKNHEDLSGKQAVIPVHYSRNAGIGSAAEDATLPSAGTQKYKQLTYSLKYLYGRIRITGQTLKATRDSKGAFAKALEREIQGMVRDFKNELNRIMNGDGTGTLTLANGAGTATATLVVDSTRFMFEDMLITIGAAASVAISTVDSDTQVTLAATRTWADNDVVKRTGADEANGIANIVDNSGSVGGISATGNLWWQSVEFASTGTAGAITEADMQKAVRSLEKRNNRRPAFIFSKHEIRDNYAALLTPNRRYNNTGSFEGGFQSLDYAGIPWYVDKDAADNTIFFLQPEHLIVFEAGPPEWIDDDGAVLNRVPDKDAFEATLKYYFQVGTDSRRLQAKITGVKE